MPISSAARPPTAPPTAGPTTLVDLAVGAASPVGEGSGDVLAEVDVEEDAVALVLSGIPT